MDVSLSHSIGRGKELIFEVVRERYGALSDEREDSKMDGGLNLKWPL